MKLFKISQKITEKKSLDPNLNLKEVKLVKVLT